MDFQGKKCKYLTINREVLLQLKETEAHRHGAKSKIHKKGISNPLLMG